MNCTHPIFPTSYVKKKYYFSIEWSWQSWWRSFHHHKCSFLGSLFYSMGLSAWLYALLILSPLEGKFLEGKFLTLLGFLSPSPWYRGAQWISSDRVDWFAVASKALRDFPTWLLLRPVTDMPPPWAANQTRSSSFDFGPEGGPALPWLQTDLRVCWVSLTLPCAILGLFIAGAGASRLFSVCCLLLPDVTPGHCVWLPTNHIPGHVFSLEPRPSDPQEPQSGGHSHLPSGLPCTTWTLASQLYLNTEESQSHLRTIPVFSVHFRSHK